MKRLVFWMVFCGFLTLSACGYHYDAGGKRKLLPNPLPDSCPFEVEGTIQHVWLGNEFQMAIGERACYLVLQGVNNPDSTQQHEDDAYAKLSQLLGPGKIRAVVHRFDDLKRGVARVYVGDMDVNLEMILSGWGRYDGETFDGAAAFSAAQEQAKENKIGIWER